MGYFTLKEFSQCGKQKLFSFLYSIYQPEFVDHFLIQETIDSYLKEIISRNEYGKDKVLWLIIESEFKEARRLIIFEKEDFEWELNH